jgi:hypothetical protein
MESGAGRFGVFGLVLDPWTLGGGAAGGLQRALDGPSSRVITGCVGSGSRVPEEVPDGANLGGALRFDR